MTFVNKIKLGLMAAGAWHLYTLAAPYIPAQHAPAQEAPHTEPRSSAESRQPPAQPQSGGELDFRVLLGNINGAWAELFRENGRTYTKPRLVLYSGQTTGCDGERAESQAGPFYNPGCRTIFVPSEFAAEIRQRTACAKTNCDFAMAVVVAHEVGHHVEQLLGLLSRTGGGPQIELMADCLAGVWSKHENDRLQKEGKPALIEPGDIEVATRFAASVGSASHGSGPQRQRSFENGWRAGTLAACSEGRRA